VRYTDRLDAAGAVRSVGSKGDSYDDAVEFLICLYQPSSPPRAPARPRRRRTGHPGVRRLLQPPPPPRPCGDNPAVEFEDHHYRSIAGLTEDAPEEPSLH
jgi:putative transposase